jgi:glutathione S-transferase
LQALLIIILDLAAEGLENLLRDDSVEFFNQSRAKDLGMSLEEYAKQGGELCWTEAFKALNQLFEFMNETKGPFVEGDEVSYTDFRILSILLFIKRIDQEVFERLMGHPKALPLIQQFEACVQWIEKDD